MANIDTNYTRLQHRDPFKTLKNCYITRRTIVTIPNGPQFIAQYMKSEW